MADIILCDVLFSAQAVRCITHPTAAAAAVQHEWSSTVYASHWDAITCRLSWSAWHGQWWPGTHSHCMLLHCYTFLFTCIQLALGRLKDCTLFLYQTYYLNDNLREKTGVQITFGITAVLRPNKYLWPTHHLFMSDRKHHSWQ